MNNQPRLREGELFRKFEKIDFRVRGLHRSDGMSEEAFRRLYAQSVENEAGKRGATKSATAHNGAQPGHSDAKSRHRPRKSAQVVAQRLGVSVRWVERARRLRDGSPDEVLDALRYGQMSLTSAECLVLGRDVRQDRLRSFSHNLKRAVHMIRTHDGGATWGNAGKEGRHLLREVCLLLVRYQVVNRSAIEEMDFEIR